MADGGVDRGDWWARYSAYLESEPWKARRKQVLHRSGGFCEAGLGGCMVKAVQAHHLTYRHVFNEPLFDLVAVCVPCHEALTEADRNRRR
jgi:hypothetical protein